MFNSLNISIAVFFNLFSNFVFIFFLLSDDCQDTGRKIMIKMMLTLAALVIREAIRSIRIFVLMLHDPNTRAFWFTETKIKHY